MGTIALIMGESGTGKSTSLRNLRPQETYIINVLNKPLPFSGFKKNYIPANEKGEGNYFASDDANKILKMINFINLKRPDIKNIVIDDFQYVMANEFMRRAKERGYDKFTEIGQNAWLILQQAASGCRDDLCVFVLSHTEVDKQGRSKCKTIGNMIDQNITLEGMFTIVLHSMISDNKYKFLTQNDGMHIAKSPMGMFDSLEIDNDLSLVKERIHSYYDSEAKL